MPLSAKEKLALSIAEAFKHRDTFNNLLVKIGIDANGIARIKTDGFTSMELISLQIKNDMKSLKIYLVNLNKTFASAGASIYFNPIVIIRFTGALHFFDQTIFVYQRIPDIRIVTEELLTKYDQLFATRSLLIESDQKEADEVKLPPFKGMEDWLQFKEKFDYKLALTKGLNNFSVDYFVTTTECSKTLPTQSWTQCVTSEIDDEDIYRCFCCRGDDVL